MFKFDKIYNSLMENISTDIMGNSEPTAGIFSGDNFARGDMRVPIPMGVIARHGQIGLKKKKRRKNRRKRY